MAAVATPVAPPPPAEAAEGTLFFLAAGLAAGLAAVDLAAESTAFDAGSDMSGASSVGGAAADSSSSFEVVSLDAGMAEAGLAPELADGTAAAEEEPPGRCASSGFCSSAVHSSPNSPAKSLSA